MESLDISRQTAPLQEMFTAVPPRYDLINRIITLGLDKSWRKLAARVCLESRPARVLDLGCGTGDLAIDMARKAEAGAEISGLDFSAPMLRIARQKARRSGVGDRIKFVQGEATKMPFPDGYFDCVGIAFAFRNLTYHNPLREPHLAEVRRVLKSGGRYVIVETSQPDNRVIKALYHIYLRALAAPLGGWLSGNKGAYRYLAGSATHFYAPGEVTDMLLAAGFKKVSYRPLFLGAAGIHVATR